MDLSKLNEAFDRINKYYDKAKIMEALVLLTGMVMGAGDEKTQKITEEFICGLAQPKAKT